MAPPDLRKVDIQHTPADQRNISPTYTSLMGVITNMRASISRLGNDFNNLVDDYLRMDKSWEIKYKSLETKYNGVVQKLNKMKQQEADMAPKVSGQSKAMEAKVVRAEVEEGEKDTAAEMAALRDQVTQLQHNLDTALAAQTTSDIRDLSLQAGDYMDGPERKKRKFTDMWFTGSDMAQRLEVETASEMVEVSSQDAAFSAGKLQLPVALAGVCPDWKATGHCKFAKPGMTCSLGSHPVSLSTRLKKISKSEEDSKDETGSMVASERAS
jgi:hypothetical protein